MKFKLTKNTKEVYGTTLYQIEAVSSFGDIKKGDLGGWIEKEENLSQEDIAWVYGNAQVSDNACVSGNAQVYGDAWVYGNALVYGNARVSGNAWVYGDAQVYGNAWVYGNARVYGDACVYGNLRLSLGYFFGFRYKKEEIKFVPIDYDYELVCKGDIKVETGEEQDSEIIELNGKKYKLIEE